MQHNYFLSSETIQAMHQKVESQDWTGLLAVTSASGYGGRDTTSTVLYDLGAEIPLLVRPVRRQNYASIHSKHPIKLTKPQRLRLFRDMAVSIMSSSKRMSAHETFCPGETKSQNPFRFNRGWNYKSSLGVSRKIGSNH